MAVIDPIAANVEVNMRNKWFSGRRAKVFLWLGAVIGVIAILLYFEQVAVIYILSTLALVLLLFLVAFADLENVGAVARREAYSGAPEPDLEALEALQASAARRGEKEYTVKKSSRKTKFRSSQENF